MTLLGQVANQKQISQPCARIQLIVSNRSRGLPFRLKLSLLIYLDHLSLEAAPANIRGRVPQRLLLPRSLFTQEHFAVLNRKTKQNRALVG